MNLPKRAGRELLGLPTRTIYLFRKPRIGAPPGELADTSAHQPTRVKVLSYNESGIDERECESADTAIEIARDESRRHWIDLQGLRDVTIIHDIARAFEVHELAIADSINTPQRPKFEAYDEHLIFIGRMFRLANEGQTFSEQLTLFLTRNVVITVQEWHGDVFDPVRARARDPKSKLRQKSAAYLAYALIDTMMDAVYPVIDVLNDQLEETEIHITTDPIPGDFTRLHAIKRELLHLGRSLRPQREAINNMIRNNSDFIDDDARFYLRDTFDHAVQVLEAVDTYRDLTGELTDLYLSVVSNRMNEIMKILTIISTIFMPLSFLAGVYGMNFQHMPELAYQWSYPIVLGVMALIGGGMLLFFRSKGWLGSRGRRRRLNRTLGFTPKDSDK